MADAPDPWWRQNLARWRRRPRGTRLAVGRAMTYAHQGYRFGEFELDIDLLELSRGGERLKLEPKTFDVLLCLIERRPHAVTREELLARLWPGSNVCYHALPSCIWRLRTALSDRAQRIVRTVPKSGYCFVAEARPFSPCHRWVLPRGEGLTLGNVH